jgi:hypothetical protein
MQNYWGANGIFHNRLSAAMEQWSPQQIAQRTEKILYPGATIPDNFATTLEECGPKTYEWLSVMVMTQEERMRRLRQYIGKEEIPGVMHDGLYYPDKKYVGQSLDAMVTAVRKETDEDIHQKRKKLYPVFGGLTLSLIVAEVVLFSLVDDINLRAQYAPLIFLCFSATAAYLTWRTDFSSPRNRYYQIKSMQRSQERMTDYIAKIEAGDPWTSPE